jgi:hypothetical protein
VIQQLCHVYVYIIQLLIILKVSNNLLIHPTHLRYINPPLIFLTLKIVGFLNFPAKHILSRRVFIMCFEWGIWVMGISLLYYRSNFNSESKTCSLSSRHWGPLLILLSRDRPRSSQTYASITIVCVCTCFYAYVCRIMTTKEDITFLIMTSPNFVEKEDPQFNKEWSLQHKYIIPYIRVTKSTNTKWLELVKWIINM